MENTILVGIMPGHREPSLHKNSFLAPLVRGLLNLWIGHSIDIVNKQGNSISLTVRVALIYVVCDIPALSKIARLLSHYTLKGCSRCLKEFPTEVFGQNPNYSRFDRVSWPKRSNESHRALARDYLTKTNRP